MAAHVGETAELGGDCGRAVMTPAPVSRERRKLFALALAALACVAVAGVAGLGDEGAASGAELLGDAGAAHSRSVLQQLLAEAERADADVGGELSPVGVQRPVELEQAPKAVALPGPGQTSKPKPCNAACKKRKEEIAARMKALRDQINHDFKAMTSVSSPFSEPTLLHRPLLRAVPSPDPPLTEPGEAASGCCRHVCGFGRARLRTRLSWFRSTVSNVRVDSNACVNRLRAQGRLPASSAVHQATGHVGDAAEHQGRACGAAPLQPERGHWRVRRLCVCSSCGTGACTGACTSRTRTSRTRTGRHDGLVRGHCAAKGPSGAAR